MVSKKYIQATVHSSSPERKKSILQIARVIAIVRATVMAIVNRKKTKTVKCQCHTSRSPNVKIDKPPSQVISESNKVQ